MSVALEWHGIQCQHAVLDLTAESIFQVALMCGMLAVDARPTLRAVQAEDLISLRLFAASLILASGAITALVANAAMRTARSFELAVRVPEFAEHFVATSVAAKGTLTLCMALPPVTSLFWVCAQAWSCQWTAFFSLATCMVHA